MWSFFTLLSLTEEFLLDSNEALSLTVAWHGSRSPGFPHTWAPFQWQDGWTTRPDWLRRSHRRSSMFGSAVKNGHKLEGGGGNSKSFFPNFVLFCCVFPLARSQCTLDVFPLLSGRPTAMFFFFRKLEWRKSADNKFLAKLEERCLSNGWKNKCHKWDVFKFTFRNFSCLNDRNHFEK